MIPANQRKIQKLKEEWLYYARIFSIILAAKNKSARRDHSYTIY